MLLFSSLSLVSLNQAQGSLGACPVGYREARWALCSGCKYTRLSSRVSDRCYGNLRTGTNLQTCPIGYPEKCIWIMCPGRILTNLSCWIPANSARYMCTSYKLRICKSVWISYSDSKSSDDTHSTPGNFNQPSSPTASLVSPTLTNPPAGQMTPWFPSLPAIACGGTSTMTTIGSIESDSNSVTIVITTMVEMMTITMTTRKIMLFR